MARINIEESLFKHHRFIDLCLFAGNRFIAVGWLFWLWKLAQEFYLKSPHGTIPFEDWNNSGLPEIIIEYGFASKTESGIAVKGAEKHFAWLKQRSEGGKIGGSTPRTLHPQNHSGKNESGVKRNESGVKPLFSSLSSQIQNTNTHNARDAREASQASPEGNQATEEGVSRCVDEWRKTLTHFGIEKDPRLDSAPLARLLRVHGEEQTLAALAGMRYEQATKTFNPKLHVSLARCMKPGNFEKFVNLGLAAHKNKNLGNDIASELYAALSKQLNGAQKE